MTNPTVMMSRAFARYCSIPVMAAAQCMTTAMTAKLYPARVNAGICPSSERCNSTGGKRLRQQNVAAIRNDDAGDEFCMARRTASDPKFHRNARPAAVADNQLPRLAAPRSRRNSARKIPKMIAPAVCPMMLIRIGSCRLDIPIFIVSALEERAQRERDQRGRFRHRREILPVNNRRRRVRSF